MFLSFLAPVSAHFHGQYDIFACSGPSLGWSSHSYNKATSSNLIATFCRWPVTRKMRSYESYRKLISFSRGCFVVAVGGPTQGRSWPCKNVKLTMERCRNGARIDKNVKSAEFLCKLPQLWDDLSPGGCFVVAVGGPTQGRSWACKNIILTVEMCWNEGQKWQTRKICWVHM